MNIKQIIIECQDKISSFGKKLPLNDYRIRLEQIDFISNSDKELWNNPGKATKLMKERAELSGKLELMKEFEGSAEVYGEFADDPEIEAEVLAFKGRVDEFEFKLMMDKTEDKFGAIVSISAGAGGSESCNWVFMLLRMYLRYCDAKGWKTAILDEHRSEENSSICIDSIAIQVEGDYAYGYLKAFNGVARLIRNSPFSSADARHTSFAAVSVVPDVDDEIEVKLDMKDVEITAETAGGKGGQNVNRVHSACRIRHASTGINIKVKTERDFHQNKATAIKMLRSKLYDIENKKRQEEEDLRLGKQSDVAFGSQIMTFTFSPYTMCADHRTGYKETDVQGVMDGNIEKFASAFLKK